MMRSLGLCLFTVAAIGVGSADASTITFNLSTQYVSANPVNNTPVSTSTAPYGTLTFTDLTPLAGSPRVLLTIQASLENSAEFFRTLVFSGTYNSFALQNSFDSKTGSFVHPTVVGSGINNVGLEPPSGFDYLVRFPETDATMRFDGTDSVSFIFTCTTAFLGVCGTAGSNPLDASHFNTPDNLGGGWYAMVWLGYPGIPNQVPTQGARYGDNTAADNTVSAVPEPASLILITSGLIGFGARRFRRPSTMPPLSLD